MFSKIKEVVVNFITSRLVIVAAFLILACAGLVYRLFYLQIINGESYLDSFQLKIKKEKSIAERKKIAILCMRGQKTLKKKSKNNRAETSEQRS